MRKLKRHIFLLLILWPLSVEAFEAHVHGTQLLSFRKDTSAQDEIPYNHYLGAGFKNQEGLSLETNMHYVRDFQKETQAFDLYQAVLEAPLKKDVLGLTFGRQWIAPGFSTFVMDGAKGSIVTESPFTFSFYAGLPSHPEVDTLKLNNSLISGVQFGVQRPESVSGSFDILYHKSDLNRKDWNQVDQLFLGTHWGVTLTEEYPSLLFFGGEFDVSGKTFEMGTLGIDLSPHKILSLNIIYNYINPNREGAEDSIAALFTGGQGHQAQMGFVQSLHENVDLFQEYVVTYFKDPSEDFQMGHDLATGLRSKIKAVGLDVEGAGHFIESYGGRAYGGHLFLEEKLFRDWSLGLHSGLLQYTKVTQDNGKTFTLVTWMQYQIFRALALETNFEFHANNDFSKDIRVGFNLQYSFGQVSIPAHGLGRTGLAL